VRGPLASDDAGGGRAADCPGVEPPAAAEGGQVVEGDVEGEGCIVYGTYQPQPLPDGSQAMILTIPLDGVDKQIGMGDPGDQLVLGDWDCDGTDTPGLYRTATGVVQYFDVWPEVEQRSYQPSSATQTVPAGQVTLVEGKGSGTDCDRLVVSALSSLVPPATGDAVPVGRAGAGARTAGRPA
jgi:hypothetical protein